jgi:hypothetical protein
MCHSAGLAPTFVEMPEPAWSTCFSPWPRCRLGAAAGDGHQAVRCPGIRFVALEAGEAAFRSAVLTHADADSLATAFLRALARTAGQGAAHSPRAAVELAA